MIIDMKKIRINGFLNNEDIGNSIEKIGAFLDEWKCDKKSIIRIKISVEEVLLTLQNYLTKDEEFQIECRKFLKTNIVTVSAVGKNVIGQFCNDESFEIPLNKILSDSDIRSEYYYEGGMNKIRFEVNAQKRLSVTQKSIVSAIIGGLLGVFSLFLPGTIKNSINEMIVSPFFSLFMSVFAGIAEIMIFLTVTQSIYLIGDKNTLQKVGSTFFRNTLGKMLLTSMVCALACVPLFHTGTMGGTQFDLSKIIDIILQIIPTNIVSPFLYGNTLQILILAVVLGSALLVFGSSTSQIKQLINQCSDIVNHIVGYFIGLMPYVIGISIFMMIVDFDKSSITGVIKLLVVFLVFIIITMLVNTLYISIRWKKDFFHIIKELMPVIIISFTTLSSVAALPLSINICEDKLHIQKKLTVFGIPMCNAIYKLGSVIYRVVICFGLAEIYCLTISPTWLLICILLSFCLSIAVPAVPGSGSSLLILLMSQLGIPMEALALAMVCGTIMEGFLTSCNVYCDVIELYNIAEELHMTDGESENPGTV